MDWSKIKRKTGDRSDAEGVYVTTEDLVRLRFIARDFTFLPRQPVTSILSGRYASRLRGRGLNFEELRRYLPGDDIRTIDWKVTARTRAPHVRVYTEEKDRAAILVIDQRLNMFFGSKRKLKSVVAAELAALAAWRCLDQGDRVGAVIFNDEEIIEVRPQRSTATVMAIFKAITRMNQSLNAESKTKVNPDALDEALTRARRLATHDMLVVLITDAFGVSPNTRRITSSITQHNDAIACLTIDNTRLSLPAERLTASDGTLQMELLFSNKKLRTRLAEDYREEQQRLTRTLRLLSAPLLLVNTEEDIPKQLRRLLNPGT